MATILLELQAMALKMGMWSFFPEVAIILMDIHKYTTKVIGIPISDKKDLGPIKTGQSPVTTYIEYNDPRQKNTKFQIINQINIIQYHSQIILQKTFGYTKYLQFIQLIIRLQKMQVSQKINTETSISQIQGQCLQDKYDVLEKIGQGSYAYVVKAKQKFGGKQMRAIKRISIDPLADQINEISRLKSLHSDHIIQFYGYILDHNSNEVNIIMQLCKGSLRDQIKAKKRFTPDLIINLTTQVTNAMLVLNSQWMMHLDLKPENILFEQENYYKLCDFGCSQLFYNISKAGSRKNAQRMISSKPLNLDGFDFTFGTPQYIAPQIQLNHKNVSKNSCDIWSFGIILYELIYNRHPFTLQNGRVKNSQVKKFMLNQYQISYPLTRQPFPIQLIKKMLKPIPTERISWNKLKEQLMTNYGKNQCEFKNVQEIAQSQIKMSLIFAQLIMLIESCQNKGQNKGFWKKNSQLISEWKKAMVGLGYAQLKKFSDLFQYKFQHKLSLDCVANLDFLFESFLEQANTYFDKEELEWLTVEKQEPNFLKYCIQMKKILILNKEENLQLIKIEKFLQQIFHTQQFSQVPKSQITIKSKYSQTEQKSQNGKIQRKNISLNDSLIRKNEKIIQFFCNGKHFHQTLQILKINHN